MADNIEPEELKKIYLKRDIAWYLTLLLLILVTCMPSPLCFLYYLSTVPDVTWQRGDLTYDRVWMARRRGPVGLGYESQRVSERRDDGQVCVTNTVRYLLWEEAGEAAEGAKFSRLFTRTDHGWQPTGEECD